MAKTSNFRALAARLLLAISVVESDIISMYPGSSSYYKTPLYCNANSQYTTISQTTACYHKLTRDQCCMATYTRSENGVIIQECLCGSSSNSQPSTATSTTTTTPSTSTTTPTTSTTTPTTSTTTPTTSATTRTTTTTAPTTTRTTTPTTTRTTTPTTTPTTTSTTTPTTLTTTQTKTTTTPSTTTSKTTPAVTSTTTPTTTSATTPTSSSATTARPTSSTTAGFQSLCSSSSFRIMNAEKVEDPCLFSGVANITQADGTIQSCNAVYTRATVNSVLKPTFLTSKACKDGVERVANSNIQSEIQIGNQAYPLTSVIFKMVEGPSGTAFIDIKDRYARFLTDLDTCQKLACPYDKNTMAGLLDFQNCKMVSWGATSGGQTFAHDGLHEATVKLTPDGCKTVKNMFGAANTMCFTTASGAKLFSQGDSGAPVYCNAESNGEWILVGIAEEQLNWGSTADLRVIPYPE